MIDNEGYRLNVGIVLCNDKNEVLWARRVGQQAWQFPQGGILENETPEQAMYRELWEEIGLRRHQVSIVANTDEWLYYQLPQHLIRFGNKPLCIGQKQIWYLLRLDSAESDIDLNRTRSPEFDHWRWVDFWYPLSEVVEFKRDVYRQALEHFASQLQIDVEADLSIRKIR